MIVAKRFAKLPVVTIGHPITSEDALAFELFDGEVQLVVPLLTESANEGLLQVFVQRNAILFASENSSTADIPAVIVQTCQGAEFLLPDGVEMA